MKDLSEHPDRVLHLHTDSKKHKDAVIPYVELFTVAYVGEFVYHVLRKCINMQWSLPSRSSEVYKAQME